MMTLETLEAELAALLAPLDLPGNWTLRQRAAYEEKRRVLTLYVASARNATATLAAVDPELAALTEWDALLEKWRAVLCKELMTFKSYERDPTLRARRHVVELSLKQIDFGLDWRNQAYPARLPLDDLMEADGCADPNGTLALTVAAAWRGSLKTVEPRLRMLRKRHDEATAQLAEALADDDEREQAAIDRAERVAKMPRKLPGYASDGSLQDTLPPG